MKKSVKILNIISAIMTLATCVASAGDGHRAPPVTTCYYVDSESGNDGEDGKSPETAWKTLNRLNECKFSPGDTVFFKASSVFDGQFEPVGSGEEGRPVVVRVYGVGRRPILNGNGEKEYTLLLSNLQHWEIEGLEITNNGPEPHVKRRGIIVSAMDCGDMYHIHLKDLVVRDVNGSITKKKGAGGAILIQNGGKEQKSRFIDLLIEHCHLYGCQRNGINFKGYSNRSEWYPNLQVVIRGNLLEGIPGDGIVPIACDGALIEKNIVRNAPDIMPIQEAAAGIWPWSCDNTVIQYNEVYNQHAKWDGQGFDADYNCRNTLFQYNYSHDNAGGFFLICCNGDSFRTPANIGTREVVIRYNVSINDGLREYETRQGMFSPTFHVTGPVDNIRIHDNIVIMPSKKKGKIDSRVVKMNNWGGLWPTDVKIWDNMFYLSGPFTCDMGEVAPEAIGSNTVQENVPDSKLNEPLAGELLGKIMRELNPIKNRFGIL